MITAFEFSKRMERTVCVMLSAVMVAVVLSLSVQGALTAPKHVPYSVTVHY
jgi:hypothetical protein